MNKAFSNKLKDIILKNLSNEQFGVSELAYEVGMSRSNLLRRIQKEENCSASQFIRKIRLEEATTILKNEDKTVSEVAFMVGFNSTSYFIKCFREQYGYPPGEMDQQLIEKELPPEEVKKHRISISRYVIWASAVVIALAVSLAILFSAKQTKVELEKSIAVLPFKNDSDDANNVYVINGVMESILNNLQSLKGLKVISRTSVEKYRNTKLSIPEIARELNVSYIVEGSGQKVGNQILLSVQLIEGERDNHLWSEQYNRQIEDIFQIQQEVAQEIAGSIEIVIGPDEQKRIRKKPTQNLLAYDYFLKGVEQLNKETEEGLIAGIPLVRKAVEEDEQFALAHGVLAIAYYYHDLFEPEKQYTDSLIYFADKALLYDATLPQALTGKALYYMQVRNYKQAIEYLETALKYNPNSAIVINSLSDIYTNYVPDTEKYLEYALRGISLDINSHDANTASYIYLHLSNALVQNGFVDEALVSINRSLNHYPGNLFSEYVKAYILYAKNKDLTETRQLLINALAKDSTRFDIMQEIGNICYYQRDWETAGKYFDQFLQIRDYLNSNAFAHKDLEMAYVYKQLGQHDKEQKLFDQFKNLMDQEQSVFQYLFKASYHAYLGEDDQAIKNLELFTQGDNIQLWVPLFTPIDPMIDSFKNKPEFIKVMNQMESQFNSKRDRLKTKLEEEGLLQVIQAL
ncbi:helix-turn-helix domain-containing protein [Carboxylicivirga sp. RSCT41]|uniref:helix-turn-helix domain-containing protein n=1 Tax=Carboxylicivirga agarovorans TaxID=3417570 RepID=UPI003D32E6D4